MEENRDTRSNITLSERDMQLLRERFGKMGKSQRRWVWVETTTGLSCIDAGSIIAISNTAKVNFEGCYTNLDLHLSSGTIFTIKLADIKTITDELPNWEEYEA